jgi:hypothetical protein
MKRINKLYVTIGMAVAFGLFLEVPAHASKLNEETTITFSAPVDIPGQVLPAGTYVFKLLNSDADTNIVQVLNADQTNVYATMQTVPTIHQHATNKTSVQFAEQGSGQPDALVKWFYPGRLTGSEFIYAKPQQTQLARDERYTVMAGPEVTNSEIQAGE